MEESQDLCAKPFVVFGTEFKSRRHIFTLIGRHDLGARRLKARYGTMEQYLLEHFPGKTPAEIVAILQSYEFSDKDTCYLMIRLAMLEFLRNRKGKLPKTKSLHMFSALAYNEDFAKALKHFTTHKFGSK